MDLTATQRAELARRIEAERYRQFRGSKKAAYTAAEVNSATWARAEGGESIKPHSLAAIVGTLWPETGGDWRNLEPPLEGATDEAELIRQSNLPDWLKQQLLARQASAPPPTTPATDAQEAG